MEKIILEEERDYCFDHLPMVAVYYLFQNQQEESVQIHSTRSRWECKEVVPDWLPWRRNCSYLMRWDLNCPLVYLMAVSRDFLH